MIQDHVGQMVFDESDLVDLLMAGRLPLDGTEILVDDSVDLSRATEWVNQIPNTKQYTAPTESVSEFDRKCQAVWHMPEEYRTLDIAAHILGLCNTEAELQRCGHELLLYCDRGLLDLLRYLKYLVDTMRNNRLIWGVGRGSSVSSYVLYKLKVHRVDSLHYDLPVEEFLR